MITIRFGDINGDGDRGPRKRRLGDRSDTITLLHPLWAATSPVQIRNISRHETTAIKDGTFTQSLGKQATEFTQTLDYIPIRHEDPTTLPDHWTQIIFRLMYLEGQWIDLYWGATYWGEWLVVESTPSPQDFGIFPAIDGRDPGLFPRIIRHTFRLISDTPALQLLSISNPGTGVDDPTPGDPPPQPVPQPPVVVAPPPLTLGRGPLIWTVPAGRNVTQLLSASGGTEPYRYYTQFMEGWITVNENTGIVTLSPQEINAGNHAVQFFVEDGAGDTVSRGVQVTVTV